MGKRARIFILLGLSAAAVQAGVVYEDDFSGAAGSAAGSVPEITVSGWAGATASAMELDGAGKLESSDAGNAAANYRFRIATNPLTANPTNEIITLSANIRTPASEWIAIGFHENNVNGLIGASGNSGPYIRFHGNSTWVGPGTGLENQFQLLNTHTAGDVISVSMEYDVQAKRLDVWMNGVLIANELAVAHEYPAGTSADPVIYWAQAHFRLQPRAVSGGAYVDDLKIEVREAAPPEPPRVMAEELYAQWTALYPELGSLTNRMDDFDGDGCNNLTEYAFGGNPTNGADAGRQPVYSMVQDGGSSWMEYAYAQPTNAFDRGLSFALSVATNLAQAAWQAAPVYTGKVFHVGTSDPVDGFEWVTNWVPVDVEESQFLRLKVMGGGETPLLWSSMLPDRGEAGAPLSEQWAYADPTRLGEWEVLRQDLKVIKLYVDGIQNAPTNVLKNMADMVREHDIKISVELGGVLSWHVVEGLENSALNSFNQEVAKMAKYTDQGGVIDYISMDDPIRRILYPEMYGVTIVNTNATLSTANAEIVKVMQLYKDIWPDTKIIYLTNFPNWGWEDGPAYNKFSYNGFDPQGRGDFKACFTDLFRQATEAGVEFYGVTADNPYNYFTFTKTSNQPQLTSLVDWPERLLTLERFAESLGLNFTLIVNSSAATTGQEFQEQVVDYVQAYKQAGGTPHAFMVQSWYEVPTQTLPETNAFTMANTVLEAKKHF